jgi:hypothetical protein
MTDLSVPARRDLPPGWVERHKQHLLSELARRPALGRRRRRLTLVLVPAAILLLAATAFATYALTREPTHFESVGCYDRADLRANTAVVNADGRTPVAICADVWRQGGLGNGTVPKRLDACVLATGAIGVFPSSGGDTCAKLGLVALPASYASEAKRFAALQDAIIARLGRPASGSSRRGPQCVGAKEATAFVKRELDAHGYRDWQIKTAGGQFSAERPCAEPSFDTAEKVVLLLPGQRTTGT